MPATLSGLVSLSTNLDIATLVLLIAGVWKNEGVGHARDEQIQANYRRTPMRARSLRAVQVAELIGRATVSAGYRVAVRLPASQVIGSASLVMQCFDGTATRKHS